MSDLEIARAAKLEPIEKVGARIGLPESALYRYGPNKAKVSLDHIAKLADKPSGKLILVTAINPTPASPCSTYIKPQVMSPNRYGFLGKNAVRTRNIMNTPVRITARPVSTITP